jgi:hypothetical protein
LSTDPQTDPRVKHLRDAQRRLRSALIANADRLDKPFTDDPGKNPWDTFVRPAMRELKAAVDAIAAMPAAPVAAPPTGQAGLVLTEDERTMLAYALDQAQEKIWSEDGFTDKDQAAVDSLRRLAAETPEPETQGDGTLLAELQQHLAEHTPSCNARTDHLMRRAATALGAPAVPSPDKEA